MIIILIHILTKSGEEFSFLLYPHQWMNGLKKKCVCVCVYTVYGILLSHKKNGILSFAAKWMELEVIV